jgi:hypothetical protein
MAEKYSERKEAFIKIPILIISGIIIGVWGKLTYILAAFHWLFTIFTAKRSKELANFMELWNTEAYKLSRYITGVSKTRPFPFSDMERISKFEK